MEGVREKESERERERKKRREKEEAGKTLEEEGTGSKAL